MIGAGDCGCPCDDPSLTPPPFGAALSPCPFRDMIYSHEASTRVRWWQAFAAPSVSPRTTDWDREGGEDAVRRVERRDSLRYRALVQPVTRAAERHLPQGTLPEGSILVTSMPDELPLASGDIVIPWGRTDGANGLPADAPHLVAKHTVARGNTEVSLAGTLTSDGPNVTGRGTSFRSDLRAGDVVIALGEALRVVSIAGDTALTLESEPLQAWEDAEFARGDDRLLFPIAFAVDALMVASGDLARPESDFRISADGTRIEWLRPDGLAPAPDETYSLIYRYFPRYVVRDDLGMHAPPAPGGAPMPQTVLAVRAPEVLRS
jgi:hypothetical protein